MSTVFLGGLNGVGKSTIINGVIERQPEIDKIHTTSLLMEHLAIPLGAYDSLRYLSEEFKLVQNGLMFERRLAEAERRDERLVFDSHYLNIVEGRVSRLIQGNWPSLLGGLVLVEADVEVIFERIEGDYRRRRLFAEDISPGQKRDAIKQYREWTREEFEGVCLAAGRPGLTIVNNGVPDAAIDQLLEFEATVTKL